MTAGVESAERTRHALEELRAEVEADFGRAEGLVGRAHAAVEALGDLDAKRASIAAATADAVKSACGLTERFATLDQRMERIGMALRAAEQTAETLERSVERGTALAERVAEAEQQIAQTASRLESATDASSEQADAARAVAERIEAAIAAATDQAAEFSALADQTADMAAQVRSLAVQMDQIHAAPDRLFAEAAASTKQITEAIQVAGRVLRALSGSASRVRDQIQTLKEVRASSDRGVSRLLEQSRASADALRQWVTDAEAARSRVAASLSVDDELADENAMDEPATGTPDLLPALAAILGRRS
jgi:chromosome segregation ATPase